MNPNPSPDPTPTPTPNPNPDHNQDEYSTLLRMQYVEIYNEQIKDLLEPSSANLDVREDPKRGTFVAGATRSG